MEKEILLQQAGGILPWLVEVRRDFHAYPEFGMEEFRTKDKICEYLDEMDIPYQAGIANTGVVGLIQGEQDGKTVALRADMDALPILEKNDIPYKSTVDGKMHACGHDAHMTVLLGAAKLLQENKHLLKGNVKLLFQPAEETVGGAEPMIKEGALENPKVDAVFGLHVDPAIPVGKIGVKYGQMNASSDTITITVKGKNAHGAYAYMGKDAIVIAAGVISALQTIVSRSVDARESAVISIGTIHGGTQGNIVADEVKLVGTVRTLTPEIRRGVLQKLEETVTYVAKGLGGEAVLSVEPGYTSLINNDEMVDIVKESGEALIGKENVNLLSRPSLGVEDFAFFAKAVPGAFFRLGVRNDEKGIVHDVHTPFFNIDEKSLKIGVAMQVWNVFSFLE
ncbi:peptidase M20 [Heyndrickxia shackletonii]|uniref:Peptidase M20 n=2 Tax=Heyndrickxia shackletonii TaxID=157838 RepID=A0A0Q3TMY7_9BACI|nr:peptidase M20 [Heyndrickxia shackletonii]